MPVLPKGRYKARVTSSAFNQKGQQGLLCLSVFFQGFAYKDNGEYFPMEDDNGAPVEDHGIYHDFFFEKKDGGGTNEKTIERLAQIFNWNGDMLTLEDHVLGRECKITVENEVYRGESKPRVKWVNHIDDADRNGGAPAVERNANAQQAARALASKVRAIVGAPGQSAPASAPRKPFAQAAQERKIGRAHV